MEGSTAEIEGGSPNAATGPPLKVGSRNSPRSNIGRATIRSTTMNRASSTAATAKQASTRLSVKDRWFDSISPQTRLDRAAVKRTKPAQSGPLAYGARDSATIATATATATIPRGTLTKQ